MMPKVEEAVEEPEESSNTIVVIVHRWLKKEQLDIMKSSWF